MLVKTINSNLSCIESTLYLEKQKVRIKFINFRQNIYGFYFFWSPFYYSEPFSNGSLGAGNEFDIFSMTPSIFMLHRILFYFWCCFELLVNTCHRRIKWRRWYNPYMRSGGCQALCTFKNVTMKKRFYSLLVAIFLVTLFP